MIFITTKESYHYSTVVYEFLIQHIPFSTVLKVLLKIKARIQLKLIDVCKELCRLRSLTTYA